MRYQLYTDGGARGNPGPAAAGVVLLGHSEQNIVKEVGTYLGETTNNEAEYRALLLGLKTAKDYGATELDCFLDSELVVKQLKGEYKVKKAELRVYWNEAKELEKAFEGITYTHVKREKNHNADKLVNEVLDALN